jgi:hypothetical protein
MRRPALRIYSIHLPPPYSTKDREPEAVREGFAPAAFLLTLVWALVHRMWLRAGVLLGLFVVFGVLGEIIALNAAGQAVVGLAIMIWAGMEGNDWLRESLLRRGWRDAGVIAADSADAAIRRYWDISAISASSPTAGPVAPSIPGSPEAPASA